ncbi:hypothetical protein RFI_12750 [Reticulomyxa filosa]|uniref:Uncharacterized protein n=1 Tax=Reticulomyxa filosa TaxID=46433 RepID=X6NFA4_RETFI|nr:hypothetical protein RFI_12750 [Reticulomyxa filosa]|eukprot:ETO24404.1 hypothetical protein RFI_12750 [Reticulomyxa filosa]
MRTKNLFAIVGTQVIYKLFWYFVYSFFVKPFLSTINLKAMSVPLIQERYASASIFAEKTQDERLTLHDTPEEKEELEEIKKSKLFSLWKCPAEHDESGDGKCCLTYIEKNCKRWQDNYFAFVHFNNRVVDPKHWVYKTKTKLCLILVCKFIFLDQSKKKKRSEKQSHFPSKKCPKPKENPFYEDDIVTKEMKDDASVLCPSRFPWFFARKAGKKQVEALCKLACLFFVNVCMCVCSREYFAFGLFFVSFIDIMV